MRGPLLLPVAVPALPEQSSGSPTLLLNNEPAMVRLTLRLLGRPRRLPARAGLTDGRPQGNRTDDGDGHRSPKPSWFWDLSHEDHRSRVRAARRGLRRRILGHGLALPVARVLGAELVAQLEEDGKPPERLLERSQPGFVPSRGEVEEVTSVLGGCGQESG